MVNTTALRALVRQLDLRVENLLQQDPSWVDVNTNISASYLRLGKSLVDAGLAEEGLATYRKALQVNPESLHATYSILFTLERLNRVDEAWETLQALERKCPSLYESNEKFILIKAQLEHRRGNLENSRDMLERFTEQNPHHSALSMAYGLLGKTLDCLGHHDPAMKAFDNKNRIASEKPIGKDMIRESHIALASVEASLSWYGGKKSFGWEDTIIHDQFPSPVLLVGFPRSGTTLLEQILNSHTALATIEEKETLSGILEKFYGNEQKLSALSALDSNEISSYRRAYWSNVANFLDTLPENKRVVDKFPLRITNLDIYARLFLHVKIIVALRDPRDVIISNYMQIYKLTPSMAANLSLFWSARHYSRVMALYLMFRKFIPGNIHEVRYEDIVRDLRGESTRILKFLGLEWEDHIERYYENAKKRWIRTPSYSQVSKPIYPDAVGRWKNYEQQLEEVKTILQPFVDEFGY